MAQATGRSPSDPPPKASLPAPFIVTAELPVDVFSWANGLRSQHFPRERNHLKAHVTLFHALAPSLRDALPRFLARVATEYAQPQAEVTGLMDLGQGTAIALRSETLTTVRNHISEHFWDMLTQQDRGAKRLHITIQNKVTRADALALQSTLGPQLRPLRFTFTGLGLHIYRNPHWEEAGVWRFRGKEGG